MQLLTASDLPVQDDVVRLPRTGRIVRLVVAGAVLVVLVVGELWGQDADFPFGPFRMYSTRADPDQPVISTRVVGLTAAGEEIRLSGGQVGLRRAEFEGQLPRIEAHPELLGLLARDFAAAHPSSPDLVSVAVIQRRYELHDGQLTDAYTDDVLLDHRVAGQR